MRRFALVLFALLLPSLALAQAKDPVKLKVGMVAAVDMLALSARMVEAFQEEVTNCWPPSMSKVAPVSAVLIMMWTASEATSAGVTTRPIGNVARS